MYESLDNNITLGNPLETRNLNQLEKQALLNGKASEIEFENYFVIVEDKEKPHNDSKAKVGSTMTSGLKLSRFKPPSTVHRVIESKENNLNNNTNIINSKKSRGLYSVEDDELNDLWDNPNSCQSVSLMQTKTISTNSSYSNIVNQVNNTSTSSPDIEDIWGVQSPIMKSRSELHFKPELKPNALSSIVYPKGVATRISHDTTERSDTTKSILTDPTVINKVSEYETDSFQTIKPRNNSANVCQEDIDIDDIWGFE